MVFIFEVCDHFFNDIDMVIKTVNIVSFFLISVQNHCFLMMQMDKIYHILSINVALFIRIFPVKAFFPCDKNLSL